MAATIPATTTYEWTHSDVNQELEHILGSDLFSRSARLSLFLRTAVEYLLQGRANTLKEYTIGVEVYDRPYSYDPTQDSIVRTEARRLRDKLCKYYAGPHHKTPITINLVPGSYIPVIAPRQASISRHYAPVEGNLTFVPAKAIRLVILPFSVQEGNHAAQHIELELAHHAAQHPDIQVFRAFGCERCCYPGHPQRWETQGVLLFVHGCIRSSQSAASLCVQLTTLNGFVVWSHVFDTGPIFHSHTVLFSEIIQAVLAASVQWQRLFKASTKLYPLPPKESRAPYTLPGGQQDTRAAAGLDQNSRSHLQTVNSHTGALSWFR